MSTPPVAIRQAVDERARERRPGDGFSDRLDYVCGPTVSYRNRRSRGIAAATMRLSSSSRS